MKKIVAFENQFLKASQDKNRRHYGTAWSLGVKMDGSNEKSFMSISSMKVWLPNGALLHK